MGERDREMEAVATAATVVAEAAESKEAVAAKVAVARAVEKEVVAKVAV